MPAETPPAIAHGPIGVVRTYAAGRIPGTTENWMPPISVVPGATTLRYGFRRWRVVRTIRDMSRLSTAALAERIALSKLGSVATCRLSTLTNHLSLA
ncbi:hypothetical protein L3V59_22190 [Burkholderia aenigmatica]|uniref:hypothetical protein n=1 Tax=Burkholderia aenigmatica TaxID=2015348 RepID=UPI001F289C4A|nr:hypothetical protein [Burkholderia aenigmatica]UKD15654.1 hypothetical protein L3V59_22190 [Burkholderia aenigmatica]